MTQEEAFRKIAATRMAENNIDRTEVAIITLTSGWGHGGQTV